MNAHLRRLGAPQGTDLYSCDASALPGALLQRLGRFSVAKCNASATATIIPRLDLVTTARNP
jgi:hypothetical protein